MPLICSYVRLTAQPMPRRPPIAQLVLVVGIERAPVEHERLPRLHVRRRVAVPDVPVHQAWLDTPPIALERPQKPLNALVQNQLRIELVIWPGRLLAAVYVKDM